MPTYSFHCPDNENAILAKAIYEQANGEKGQWLREAARQRLERDGYLVGTPAHDIRAEALSAAEIAGPEAVLKALRSVKAEAAANAA